MWKKGDPLIFAPSVYWRIKKIIQKFWKHFDLNRRGDYHDSKKRCFKRSITNLKKFPETPSNCIFGTHNRSHLYTLGPRFYGLRSNGKSSHSQASILRFDSTAFWPQVVRTTEIRLYFIGASRFFKVSLWTGKIFFWHSLIESNINLKAPCLGPLFFFKFFWTTYRTNL